MEGVESELERDGLGPYILDEGCLETLLQPLLLSERLHLRATTTPPDPAALLFTRLLSYVFWNSAWTQC